MIQTAITIKQTGFARVKEKRKKKRKEKDEKIKSKANERKK